MAGISSKAANMRENKIKYQQYELNTDFDINLYESFYRSHDPQLGRFWQVDPKAIDEMSPYCSMGNNPISMTDFLGDTTTYFDIRGNTLLTTNVKGYNNAFIIDDNSLDNFKRMTESLKKNPENEDLFDKLMISFNQILSYGDVYDVNSINDFYVNNASKHAIEYIDGIKVGNIKSAYIDNKKVSKNALMGQKGAEADFSMIKKDGVWIVDNSSIRTKNDMRKSYSGSSSAPHGHLHPFLSFLEGKQFRFTANDGSYHDLGLVSKNQIPSGSTGGGDAGQASSEGKNTGTLRNVVVNYSHIYFYNGSSTTSIQVARPK
jgi:RHS repeat-associated protein